MRPSIWVQKDNESIIIDSSSDFRAQCLRWNIGSLDAVIYTHHHYDHIAGFDDLRAFNFKSRKPMPVYGMEETLGEIRRMFSYAFSRDSKNLSSSPVVDPEIIDDEVFTVGSLEILPVPLIHGHMRVNGYRIGDFAYCTDCNIVPEDAYQRLEGVKTLILDGLRFSAHPTHLTVDEAIEIAQRVGAEQTFLTHIAHDILHEEVQKTLPPKIYLAYDGLELIL